MGEKSFLENGGIKIWWWPLTGTEWITKYVFRCPVERLRKISPTSWSTIGTSLRPPATSIVPSFSNRASRRLRLKPRPLIRQKRLQRWVVRTPPLLPRPALTIVRQKDSRSLWWGAANCRLAGPTRRRQRRPAWPIGALWGRTAANEATSSASITQV